MGDWRLAGLCILPQKIDVRIRALVVATEREAEAKKVSQVQDARVTR